MAIVQELDIVFHVPEWKHDVWVDCIDFSICLHSTVQREVPYEHIADLSSPLLLIVFVVVPIELGVFSIGERQHAALIVPSEGYSGLSTVQTCHFEADLKFINK